MAVTEEWGVFYTKWITNPQLSVLFITATPHCTSPSMEKLLQLLENDFLCNTDYKTRSMRVYCRNRYSLWTWYQQQQQTFLAFPVTQTKLSPAIYLNAISTTMWYEIIYHLNYTTQNVKKLTHSTVEVDTAVSKPLYIKRGKVSITYVGP